MKEARRIWLMDQRLIRAQRRGRAPSFKEHILTGYQGLVSNRNLLQISNLASQCTEKRLTLAGGAEVILLVPVIKSSQVLVSFHGGPESYEGTEIRYLGLYRALLKKGWTIAILNYRGSTKLSSSKKNNWKNWKNSIISDFKDLKSIPEIKLKTISLLGASFGGALALIISRSFKIKKCVLLSPLLDLKTQRDRAGHEYKSWFSSRFSLKDYEDFSFKNLTEELSAKALVICSQKDEVLGNSMNRLLISRFKNSLAFKVLYQRAAHLPKSYHLACERYDLAFKFLND